MCRDIISPAIYPPSPLLSKTYLRRLPPNWLRFARLASPAGWPVPTILALEKDGEGRYFGIRWGGVTPLRRQPQRNRCDWPAMLFHGRFGHARSSLQQMGPSCSHGRHSVVRTAAPQSGERGGGGGVEAGGGRH